MEGDYLTGASSGRRLEQQAPHTTLYQHLPFHLARGEVNNGFGQDWWQAGIWSEHSNSVSWEMLMGKRKRKYPATGCIMCMEWASFILGVGAYRTLLFLGFSCFFGVDVISQSLFIIWLYSGWFMRGNGQTNNTAQLKRLENMGHVEGWGFAQRRGDAEVIFIHP